MQLPATERRPGSTLTASPGSKRGCHPSVGGPLPSSLPFDTLEIIAAGLAYGARTGTFAWTDGAGHRVALLAESPLYSAWLVSWSPSGSIDVAGWSGVRGYVHVDQGLLTVERGAPGSGARTSVTVAAGHGVALDGGASIRNATRCPARSVHVSSPPVLPPVGSPTASYPGNGGGAGYRFWQQEVRLALVGSGQAAAR
jgi:hypothetical protein